MLRIRLRRVGAKKQPSYRIVVADSRSPRDGRFLEKIGFYNPRTQPATMEIDEARALYWLSHGAKPSDAVHRILDHAGTIERFGRWRAGEDVDALIAEATEAAEARTQGIDRRTRRDDTDKKKVSKRAQAKAAAAAEAVAEAPAEEEVAETEAEIAEETVEAVTEEAPEISEPEAEATAETESAEEAETGEAEDS